MKKLAILACCMLALPVMAAGPGQIMLTDDFGTAIKDAEITLRPMDGQARFGATLEAAEFRAVELADGSYMLPDIQGAVVVEVAHPSYGTAMLKAEVTQGQPLELLMSGSFGNPQLGIVGQASAARTRTNAPRANLGGPSAAAPGETCADALDVTLDFNETSSLTGYVNNYNLTCGVDNGVDGVYHYAPPADVGTQCVNVTTCHNDGVFTDTILEVREDGCAASDALVCADDNCSPDSFESDLPNVPMQEGSEYYVIVQGWGGALPLFQITMEEGEGPCVIDCPPDGILEGEDNCGLPLGADSVNGGCNTSTTDPPLSPINCGETYCSSGATSNAGTWRDTDWYEVVITEPVEWDWCCIGEMELLIGRIAQADTSEPIDCGNTTGGFFEYAFVQPFSGDCVGGILNTGTYWFFAAPDFFQNVSCPPAGEYNYTCEMQCVDLCPDVPGGGGTPGTGM